MKFANFVYFYSNAKCGNTFPRVISARDTKAYKIRKLNYLSLAER
jgi:hypothetical protein